jgi:hypothetical protein
MNDSDLFTSTYLSVCPPFEYCSDDVRPPETSGGVTCSWHSSTHFTGEREEGVVSGTWSGMYYTTDCLNGNHEPVHMGYMFIRAEMRYASEVYQTAPARTCTASSSQCGGLTAQGNDAACSPCNGTWYLVVTATYRLNDAYGGGWPAQDSDGPCTRSSDHRQIDCQKSVGAIVE